MLVTVDVVLLGIDRGALSTLLIRRVYEPFQGAWALPGGWGHVDEDRDLEAAARRVLADKTGVP